MKKVVLILSILIIAALSQVALTPEHTYRRVVNTSFGAGEHLEYKVHYGIINAAEAVVDVAPTVYKVNERPCYRVNVYGRTVGAFDLVTRIRDTWRSYIDTTAILPQKFFSHIEEGNHRKEESITFYHHNNTVHSEEKKEKEVFKVPDNVHDVISGYYYLRTIDFNRLNIGQIVEVPAFFDDEIYNMRVRYRGKDVVKTKFGSINVIKLNPIMPENKLFKGEDAIRIWVSDDANKIPVKVEVELWVGSMEMDLKKHSGLRNDLRFYKR
ncbi:DUF3108 domain-containing protein [Larkinella soli]|uniref:DUF3108 domain-containing protein n=1 Tax=Larkinella soli TaxID=1770527 RepID=UPI000FFBFDF5|nr:DUF3108 domain-containing protein [Larkinella soli]